LVGDVATFDSEEKIKINKNPDSHLHRTCSASHLDP